MGQKGMRDNAFQLGLWKDFEIESAKKLTRIDELTPEPGSGF